MGMYTELVLGIQLRKLQDHERYVLEILEYMCGKTKGLDVSKDKLEKEHPLFQTERWHIMLCCDSYYFDGQTNSFVTYDEDSTYLTVRCNLKNYDHEIQHFLDWIARYSDYKYSEFVGYMRYETCDFPTLIYLSDDGVRYGSPTEITWLTEDLV